MKLETPKYLDFQTSPGTLEQLRQRGHKIVLCHGVFDLLHPGHLAHLQEAKELGDVLVVSITSAPFVNRGPGRPIFSDELRVYALSSLAFVDFVMVAPGHTALEVIEKVRPDYYVKGHEYADASNDVTNNIDIEAERTRAFGGEVRYTGKIVFSSTKLINNHLNILPPQVRNYVDEFNRTLSFEQVREGIEAMQGLKVLVLGEIIIDEFVHCQVQGLTSKGRVISTRYLSKEQHLGGSLAIARHVANFTGNVAIAGAVGRENNVRTLLSNELDSRINCDLLFEDDAPTITKRRYIEKQGKRESYNKLFSLNEFEEGGLSQARRLEFMRELERRLPEFDLIIVADYGHGLIDATMMALLQEKASFLAINVQTNSANYGYNLITKYKHAHAFCLDEQEIRLAFSDRFGDEHVLLQQLMQTLSARQGWLTLGSAGSLGMSYQTEFHRTPALTLQVKDTTGAGDAFLALASLAARLGLSLPLGSLMGNLAAAIAANVLGNAEPVGKTQLLKFAETVLKQ